MTAPFSSNPDASSRKSSPLVLLVGDSSLEQALPPHLSVRGFEGPGPQPAADLLIVDAARVTPPLLDWLGQEAQADLPVIVIADAESAEAAGGLLGARVIAFLAPDCQPETLAETIRQALRASVVSDQSHMFDARIERLKEEAERMAAAVAELAAERSGEVLRGVDAPRIRAHIKARRLRDRFFDPALFADPAWDILLDLAAARLEGRPVSVSSLCIAASVPTTTGLRWIKALVDRGLLERQSDREDARRAFISLAPATARRMEECLVAVFNVPGL